MKEIMHKMRKCGIIMTFLFAFTLLFGMGSDAQAADGAGEAYDAGTKGSITVTLPDLTGADKEGVQVNLYKVGDLDTSKGYLDFSLVEALKDVNVDLNDITTEQANADVAEALATAVQDREIGTTDSLWTNADGVVKFENLEQGMYLITQGNSNAYGIFGASVVPVPYANETSWNYDVSISPKADPVTTLGRIDVTKTVKSVDGDGNLQGNITAVDATYYIGLFLDAAGTQPYRGAGNSVKAVHIMDGNSATISFDNIPITDQKYYVFETTADGEPIAYLEPQGTENPFYCMAGEDILAEGKDTAPIISLEDETDHIGSTVISNVYTDGLPEGFYYTGDITISKSVMNEGKMITTDDTFYAGIFTLDSQGNISSMPVEVVKLNNNGTVTVTVPLGGTNGTEPITYAVRETNEKGVPVSQDSSFLYTVTGEGNVNLSMNQNTASVAIVNTLGGGDGYYQEEPSTQEPAAANPGSGNGNNGNSSSGSGSSGSGSSSRSSSSAKTGDNNQILLYAGLLAAAVVVGGVVVVRRRRRNG